MKIQVRATAPSNIALIKYMGKISSQQNQPVNSSLSFTLEYLRTAVVIEKITEEFDQWDSLVDPEFPFQVELSEAGKQRFLVHFKRIKDDWEIPGSYRVCSANNFPSDCGLASSASSFAALTLATAQLAERAGALSVSERAKPIDLQALSELSRKGSGSSCRSFFSPWAVWTQEGAHPIELPYRSLIHQAVVVESAKKSVSSSEAHQRVVTSDLFFGRSERAQRRLDLLVKAMQLQNWTQCFEICWAEFWDMHCLFETSKPSFGYMKPESLAVLEIIKNEWEKSKDGPLVTMDAGANVHLLYRLDQKELASQLSERLGGVGRVFGS